MGAQSQPARPTLSERIYQVERRFAAVATGLIGLVVFLDVVHRIASDESGLMGRVLGPGPWTGPLGLLLGVAFSTAVVQAALRMRGAAASPGTWGRALGVTLAAWLLLRLFLWALPNGLVWSQTVGLVLMLWVGVVGASMAAYERRHLALDLGSKLWPAKLLPKVQGVGYLVSALFCFALAGLALVSLKEHRQDFADGGGTFVAVALPKFAAFTIIPVGFLIMGARFVAQMRESFGGRVEEDDALHMLGLQPAPHEPAHAHIPGEEDSL